MTRRFGKVVAAALALSAAALARCAAAMSMVEICPRDYVAITWAYFAHPAKGTSSYLYAADLIEEFRWWTH
jgi:hypothetical protein